MQRSNMTHELILGHKGVMAPAVLSTEALHGPGVGGAIMPPGRVPGQLCDALVDDSAIRLRGRSCSDSPVRTTGTSGTLPQPRGFWGKLMYTANGPISINTVAITQPTRLLRLPVNCSAI